MLGEASLPRSFLMVEITVAALLIACTITASRFAGSNAGRVPNLLIQF